MCVFSLTCLSMGCQWTCTLWWFHETCPDRLPSHQLTTCSQFSIACLYTMPTHKIQLHFKQLLCQKSPSNTMKRRVSMGYYMKTCNANAIRYSVGEDIPLSFVNRWSVDGKDIPISFVHLADWWISGMMMSPNSFACGGFFLGVELSR